MGPVFKAGSHALVGRNGNGPFLIGTVLDISFVVNLHPLMLLVAKYTQRLSGAAVTDLYRTIEVIFYGKRYSFANKIF